MLDIRWPVANVSCTWTVTFNGPGGDSLDLSLDDLAAFMAQYNPADEEWDEVSRSTRTIYLEDGVQAEQITRVRMRRPDGTTVTLKFNGGNI